jgi:hypothetical protein
MQRWSSIVLACLLGTSCGASAPPEPEAPAGEIGARSPTLVGVSGIAPLGDRLFVLVHDTKRGEETPRLGALTLDERGGLDYRPLSVDWSSGGELPSDLETITKVPGMPGHYLAVESGHRDGITARLFHLRISGKRLDEVVVHIAGRIDLPPDVAKLEGATLLRRPDDGLVLLLCERDERKIDLGQRATQERFALIRWAPLDLEGQELGAPLRSTRIHAAIWPEGKKLRTCSELHLEGSTLWIAATIDPKGDGPFDTVIYRTTLTRQTLSENEEPTMRLAWRVRDLKVEALASSPFPGAGLIIGTDEDEQGGQVRILPPLD